MKKERPIIGSSQKYWKGWFLSFLLQLAPWHLIFWVIGVVEASNDHHLAALAFILLEKGLKIKKHKNCITLTKLVEDQSVKKNKDDLYK